MVAASRLGQQDLSGLEDMFYHLDADKSGQLSADELMVALRRQGRTVSQVGVGILPARQGGGQALRQLLLGRVWPGAAARAC